jgi:hypothetical protein
MRLRKHERADPAGDATISNWAAFVKIGIWAAAYR